MHPAASSKSQVQLRIRALRQTADSRPRVANHSHVPPNEPRTRPRVGSNPPRVAIKQMTSVPYLVCHSYRKCNHADRIRRYVPPLACNPQAVTGPWSSRAVKQHRPGISTGMGRSVTTQPVIRCRRPAVVALRALAPSLVRGALACRCAEATTPRAALRSAQRRLNSHVKALPSAAQRLRANAPLSQHRITQQYRIVKLRLAAHWQSRLASPATRRRCSLAPTKAREPSGGTWPARSERLSSRARTIPAAKASGRQAGTEHATPVSPPRPPAARRRRCNRGRARRSNPLS